MTHLNHLEWPNPCSVFNVTSQYSGRLLLLSMVTLAAARSLPAQAADGSTSDEYRRTVQALEHYRVLASEDDGETLPATKKPVEPGGHYAGVPRLIRLLTRLGDLPADTQPADTALYSGALVAAVKRFQTRHGLEPDGRIGKGTLAQLNTPLSFRVRQLELALERWRRVSYDPSRPAIVLNLPEFRLRAFDPGQQPALEMKIVIGRARKLETPLLSSQVDTVIFRPYWNVPLSIQRKELVGDIQRDPSYISKNDFELVTPQNAVVAEDTDSHMMLAAASLRQASIAPATRTQERPGTGEVRVPERIRRLHARYACKIAICPRAPRFQPRLHSPGKSRGPGGVGAADGIRLAAGSHRGSDAGNRNPFR